MTNLKSHLNSPAPPSFKANPKTPQHLTFSKPGTTLIWLTWTQVVDGIQLQMFMSARSVWPPAHPNIPALEHRHARS
jgi:hypothetical protein